MYNILVVFEGFDNKVIKTNYIPRIGEAVDMFCEPLPTVRSVVNFPSNKRLKALKADKFEIQIIIYVRDFFH